MKSLFFENGAIYIFDAEKFKNYNRIINHLISTYDEISSLDIDTIEDIRLLKIL